MYAQLSLQNVKLVGANAFLDLESTPVTITFEAVTDLGEYSRSEIVLHLVNAELARALVKAINETIAAHPIKIAEAA